MKFFFFIPFPFERNSERISRMPNGHIAFRCIPIKISVKHIKWMWASANGISSFHIHWPAIRQRSMSPVCHFYSMNFLLHHWFSKQIFIFHADTLNGGLKLTQSGQDVRPHNVSTAIALEHQLDIRREDLDSITNASSTITHWFVDCEHVRETTDMKFQHTFNEPNRTHHIEALIEASFEPKPTKPVPTLKSKLISNWRTQHKADLPYICRNRSKISPDSNKIYGHFETNVTVFGKHFNLENVPPMDSLYAEANNKIFTFQIRYPIWSSMVRRG